MTAAQDRIAADAALVQRLRETMADYDNAAEDVRQASVMLEAAQARLNRYRQAVDAARKSLDAAL